MILQRVLPSLLLVGLLPACTSSALAETGSAAFEKAFSQSDFRIVPSENRIGPIRMGMTLEEVVKLLGRPEKIPSEPKGTPGFVYLYDERAFHVSFIGGAIPRVDGIKVWDTRFELENGAHVGRFTSYDVARWYPSAESLDRYRVIVRFPSGPHLTFYVQEDYSVNGVWLH